MLEKRQIFTDMQKEEEYIDIFTILCYMKGIPLNDLHFFMKRDWKARQELPEGADHILIFMPEGVGGR